MLKKQRHKKNKFLCEVSKGVYRIPEDMILDFTNRVNFKRDNALQRLIVNKVNELKELASFFGCYDKVKHINAKENYLRICKLYNKRANWKDYTPNNDSHWKSQFKR